MTTMYVTHPGDAGTHLDREYYVRHHLLLIMDCWSPLGLESCAAFWPVMSAPGRLPYANAGSAMRRRGGLRSPRPSRGALWRTSHTLPAQSRLRVWKVGSDTKM